MNNGDESTDSKGKTCEEVPGKKKRILNTGYTPPERDYPLGHCPIKQTHLEFDRLAREALRKDGIYPTKNNTILRVIK